jgi:DNA replication protein DnaC
VEREIRQRPEMWFWMHRRWQRNLGFAPPAPEWVEGNRRRSGLPRDKTFASLDGEALPPRALRELRQLVDPARLEAAANGLILGPQAAGKTHAACAVGDALIDRGHPVRFMACADLVRQLVETARRGRMSELLCELDLLELLILDALEELPRDAESSSALLALLGHRQGGRSLLITSRLAPEAWGDVFADAEMTREAVGLLTGSARVDLSRPGLDVASPRRESA